MVKEIVCISSVRNHAIPAPDITKYAAKPDSYDRLSAAQIGDFFKKHEAFTQEYCNRLAANLVKSTVSPTLVQGATSYTVVADNAAKVVQFRTHELDMLSIELARKSYAGFVPRCEAYGKLGTIHMYVWELVRGQAFCRVRHRFLAPDMEEFLTQTIRDFARFFASAWTNGQSVELPPSLCDEYMKTLDTLSQSLPQRFLPKLEEVRLSLPLLFRTEYPVVVQHDDLLENNIHVDEDTGRITGIVDWHDAMIAPFGVSLGSLEIVLGVQNGSTWHLHYDHVNLRKHFWDTLYGIIGEVSDVDRQCISIARLLGLFRLYGPEENAAAYLDVLCWP